MSPYSGFDADSDRAVTFPDVLRWVRKLWNIKREKPTLTLLNEVPYVYRASGYYSSKAFYLVVKVKLLAKPYFILRVPFAMGGNGRPQLSGGVTLAEYLQYWGDESLLMVVVVSICHGAFRQWIETYIYKGSDILDLYLPAESA